MSKKNTCTKNTVKQGRLQFLKSTTESWKSGRDFLFIRFWVNFMSEKLQAAARKAQQNYA